VPGTYVCRAESGKARAGNLWHRFVFRVGNNVQQFRDPFTPDWRDNAELGKVRSDRINHRSLLADDRIACAVKHQVVLLLRCLCWYESRAAKRAIRRFAFVGSSGKPLVVPQGGLPATLAQAGSPPSSRRPSAP
jgi:hypothetical protein